MSVSPIELRGVRVHNLQQVDLDIPRNRLVVVCGVSGSGKTSLALDTLYAEGQRRYVESFSAYTRQYLEQLEKPEAERIRGIPAAIAVARATGGSSTRATVGSATEILDYLRLLFARVSHLNCPQCGQAVRRDSAATIADWVSQQASGRRFQIAYPVTSGAEPGASPSEGSRSDASIWDSLQEQGFLRIVAQHKSYTLPDRPSPPVPHFHVIVDRLKAGDVTPVRLRDSLETALRHGDGRCDLLLEGAPPAHSIADPAAHGQGAHESGAGREMLLDGRAWELVSFSQNLECAACHIDFPTPEPHLFSFNSALGACPKCEGFGNTLHWDMHLIVPDRKKTLRAGAIACWNSPAYAHEQQELLALAPDYGIPIDVPFEQLTPSHLQLIDEGVPERKFGGLQGFFAWLEKRKYKVHIRAFMSRWRSESPCTMCHGRRLRETSLAWRLTSRMAQYPTGESPVSPEKATEPGPRVSPAQPEIPAQRESFNIAQISALQIHAAQRFFESLVLSAKEQQLARGIVDQVRTRLRFLTDVGLGYLTLDRSLRTLSGGETHRVSLTKALGSSLVNMLYVLDEPSVGLHPSDTDRLLESLVRLRDRGNSVVIVEHDEAILRAADHVVELGPGAGERGGRVVFAGSPQDLLTRSDSLTSDYLTGRRGRSIPLERRAPRRGAIRLTNARGHNLQGIDVEFPLGLLCVVTGVSGAGKSSLVQDTLFPALCRRKHKEFTTSLPYDDVFGDGQIDDVISIDAAPIGRSARSNPVTYVKAFDAIRAVFAETMDARTRNIPASSFSFNVDGGRCPTCQGEGYVQIDMQFLTDVMMRCSECQGKRYRREILQVAYRGLSIADVLNLSVREAIRLFRGHEKVQERLQPLIDVGLDYLHLGQPASTLSAGEAQRLKLASFLSRSARNRTLFLLDEPTTGLHFNDIVQLLDCFNALVQAGHSLIVVEHNLQLMLAADFLIDLGPGAAEKGGRVVAQGTPERVADCEHSLTGSFLRQEFQRTIPQES